MLVRTLTLCLIFLFSSNFAAEAKDDFQYWSQFSLKTYDGKIVDLITFSDLRLMEDASTTGFYYISERLKIDYWKHLSLGLNYTYINTRNTAAEATDTEYKTHHRLEVEGNPSWNVGDGLNVTMRNRMEFRWIENRGSHNTRYRQRWTLTHPIKNTGPLTALYVSGEWFYNIAEHHLDENWMVPVGTSFKINEKTSADLYYMIQSRRGSDDWSSNQILGTLIKLQF